MSDSAVLCVGELLWDSLPAGLFLGGAPFNVACHLRAAGVAASLVSRVGDDRLGEEALRRAAHFGVGVELVQVDRELPTGFVRVALSSKGEPAYEIAAPAAWDAIAWDDALLEAAVSAPAIVCGSLAQRSHVSRSTIERLCATDTLIAFDVNLRPPYDDRSVVQRTLSRARVVKATWSELRRIAEWFELPFGRGTPAVRTVRALVDTFGCDIVCVTRGRQGAALWRKGRWTEQAGYEVEVRDTVGAGDAFLAVLLAGILGGADDSTMLRNATLMGAVVVSQYGALPPEQIGVSVPEPH